MSQGGANSSSGTGGNPIETLTANSGGAVGPDGSMNIDILGNNSTGIDIVGTPASNLLTVIGLAASDTQIGTVELATDAETIAYTSTILAITPANLSAGFASPNPIGSTTPNSGTFTIVDVDNLELNGNTVSTTDVNGDLLFTPNGTGNTVVSANNLYVGAQSPSNPYNIAVEDSVAGTIGISIQNTSVGATASSTLQLIDEPATADPYVLFNINGAATYSVGIDNSDSDNFKITTGATPSAATNALQITSAGVVTLPAAPLDVPSGGTGINTATAYAVLCGGTAATNPFQSIASVGTAGQVLTSNGAGALPTFQDATAEQIVAVTLLDDTDSPYTVLSTDYYMSCNVSMGVLTIDLPNAPTTGTVYVVKDSGGDAATNNITVTTVGGVVTIDGATSVTMNTAYEALQFLFNGTSWEVF